MKFFSKSFPFTYQIQQTHLNALELLRSLSPNSPTSFHNHSSALSHITKILPKSIVPILQFTKILQNHFSPLSHFTKILPKSIVLILRIHPKSVNILRLHLLHSSKSFPNSSFLPSEFIQNPSKSFFCPLPYYQNPSKFNRFHPVDSLESVPKCFCFLAYHQNPSKLNLLHPISTQNPSKLFACIFRIHQNPSKILRPFPPNSSKIHQNHSLASSAFTKICQLHSNFPFQTFKIPSKTAHFPFSKSHIAPISF